MSYQKMADLIQRQDEEKKDLAAGVYGAWQQVIQQNEMQILSLYNGIREKIPAPIQEKLDRARATFFEEWGSEGRLAALMASRHAREREELAEELQGGRQSNKDRGR